MKLSLDYTYNLIDVKEIEATDSILTLDEKYRKCQEKPQDVCTNEKFIAALRRKCQCLPFQLRFLVDKVCIQNELIKFY